MRLLHYPPQIGEVDDRVIGIGAHSECVSISSSITIDSEGNFIRIIYQLRSKPIHSRHQHRLKYSVDSVSRFSAKTQSRVFKSSMRARNGWMRLLWKIHSLSSESLCLFLASVIAKSIDWTFWSITRPGWIPLEPDSRICNSKELIIRLFYLSIGDQLARWTSKCSHTYVIA
jgi:hypothetical protein